MQVAFKVKKFGDHAERRTFSKIKSTLELTDLLEIQKKSTIKHVSGSLAMIFESKELSRAQP